MLRLFLLLTMYFYGTTSYLASCTEDSQCPSRFYCEENAHYCRECVRCDEFRREEPQAVSCVKSVLQCGPCLKSALHGDDKLNNNCVNTGKEDYAPHAYLPTYAWAVIIVALLLMFITLCVFLKTKTFKVTSYPSRTSVRAADVATACQPLAPPPYNYSLPPLIPHLSTHVSAPEIQRLVESPQPCKKPSQTGPLERPREGSTSQAARPYNDYPTYVRVPQNQARSSTPESSTLSPEMSTVDSPVMEVANSPEAAISSKLNNSSFTPKDVPERDTNCVTLSRIEQAKDQDSNNNRSSPEGSCHQDTPSGESPCRDAYIIGGPSFVINVVENINNLRQRNDTYCRFDST